MKAGHQSERSCNLSHALVLVSQSHHRYGWSCHTDGWVVSHRWMSHVTQMDESYHTAAHAVERTFIRHIKMSHGTQMSHVTQMSHGTQMNEQCHTHEWVMRHTWMSVIMQLDQSYHAAAYAVERSSITCMSHTHTNASWTSYIWMWHVTPMDAGCHTDRWVMSHIWMSHVTRGNVSSQRSGEIFNMWHRKYEWVSHFTRMDESCHTDGWVMPHRWMSRSLHTYGWVMSHRWMSHVTQMNESCHTDGWVMSHRWMSRITHMNESESFRARSKHKR